MTGQLGRLTREPASRSPDQTAMVFDGRELSFAELRRRVDEVASDLRSRGVGPRAPLGISMANSADVVVALLAGWSAGAMVVDLSPGLTPATRSSALEQTGAAALWTENGLAPAGGSSPGTSSPGAGSELELACVTFTSGSTGSPKGVMLGEENLIRNAQLYVDHFGLTPADRTCLVLPLSFGMNKIALLAHLMIGATVLLEPNLAVPNRALAAMTVHRGTGLCLVPTAADHLLARGDLDRYPLDHLRYVRIGAGRMDPERVRSLRHRFPHAEIFLTYGLTEVGLVASMTGLEHEERPDSCGRVIPEVEVRVDEDGGIVVGAGHRALGYWGDESATRAVFQADGIHTGDVGRLDRDGYLYLTGRAKDVIRSGGESIDPAEIEAVLLAHPDVEECVVLGVPDAWLGESIEAFVVPRPGAEIDEADLRAHVTRLLPPIRRPKRIRVATDLPRTETGKVRRESLRGHPGMAPSAARETGGPTR